MLTFQEMIDTLHQYWAEQGCLKLTPLDIEVGAGTFHPATFMRAIGPEPWSCALVQPSRRPADGRYGENPNRLQQHHQFQVVLKPSPDDIQRLYLGSLEALGVDTQGNDIRFVEDNWESPTLGAWGLGWEVWLNGMEVTQFTYFQQVGGLPASPVTGELAYGLERLAMLLQNVDNVYDLVYARVGKKIIHYRDIYHQNEVEMSTYHFEKANIQTLLTQFDLCEAESLSLLEQALPIPAYEQMLKASHIFNGLDARNALSTTERQRFILRVRHMAQSVAKQYYAAREALDFPLCKKEADNV